MKLQYQCEICEAAYAAAADALACEALGLPEPMPHLPLDRDVPAFGDNGVVFGKIRALYSVRSHDKHVWLVDFDRYVSENQSEDGRVHINAFDPRCGLDAFRYHCNEHDVTIWEQTMKAYGYPEESASACVLDRIRTVRPPLVATARQAAAEIESSCVHGKPACADCLWHDTVLAMST